MNTIPGLTENAARNYAAASEYFLKLKGEGIAPANVHECKGDVLYDVTIEGVRFWAHMGAEIVVNRDDGLEGCHLGVASIHLARTPGYPSDPLRWMVCKYDARQARIDLSMLSQDGIRSFAVTFGVPISACPFGAAIEGYGFYTSPAFAGLVAWAQRRPGKFKSASENSPYLGHWKELVQSCIDQRGR